MKTLGLIGLGEAGFPLALRLRQIGVTVVAYDHESENRQRSAVAGIVTTSSVQAVVLHLPVPKIVWLMLPPGEATESAIAQLAGLLEAGDVVIDGSQSDYEDSIRRYHFLKEKKIHLLDCGWSEEPDGTFTLVGGDREAFEICREIVQLFSKITPPLFFSPEIRPR